MKILELNNMKKSLELAIERESELLEVQINNDNEYKEIVEKIEILIDDSKLQIIFYQHSLEFSAHLYEDDIKKDLFFVNDECQLIIKDEEISDELRELARRFTDIVKKFY